MQCMLKRDNNEPSDVVHSSLLWLGPATSKVLKWDLSSARRQFLLGTLHDATNDRIDTDVSGSRTRVRCMGGANREVWGTMYPHIWDQRGTGGTGGAVQWK